MHSKKISVLVTTHNGKKFIRKQINSIIDSLFQHKNYEILISDDSSTDETFQILKNIKNNKIKLFKNNFKNINQNINFLINKSKGDYIFISDQDDIWEIDKIKVCMHYHNLGYSFISHNFKFFENQRKPKYKKQEIKKINFSNLLYKNQIAGCTMSFHKKCIKYFNPVPLNIIYDWWIAINIYYNLNPSKIKHLNISLLNYRVHNNNLIGNTKKSKQNIIQKILYRIVIIFEFLKKNKFYEKNNFY